MISRRFDKRPCTGAITVHVGGQYACRLQERPCAATGGHASQPLPADCIALPQALSAHIKKFLKEDDLLDAARNDDLMERVDEAFRSDFEKRSFQVTKNIEEHLRIVGYENVLHEVAVKAHLNENTLRADLDRFTLRRHAIAHRGDYDLSENRMPVILGPAARDQWLDRKADLGALLAAVVKPFPAPEMKAFEVSALVNSPKNNSVENVRPV